MRPSQPVVRAMFFEEDDAVSVSRTLARDGFEAVVRRDRFAGEDDDEDQPWAVLTEAPAGMLELLAEQYDGWVEHHPPGAPAAAALLDLPAAPRRAHRPRGGDS